MNHIPTPALAAGLVLPTFGPMLDLNTDWFDHVFYRPAIAGQSVQQSDGSVYLPKAGNGYGICTARPNAQKPGGFEGVAFAGDFYAEARLSFPPALTLPPGRAWPAFWANCIESMVVNKIVPATQWPNQAPGYGTEVEIDIFELDGPDVTKFGHGMHHWYGVQGSGLQVLTAQPVVTITPETFNKPNLFGFLHVAATTTTKGSASWFFNGSQVGPTETWNLYNPALAPPPVEGSSAYAIMDTLHYPLIISTSDLCPMTVHSVTVWQSSGIANWAQ